jgi:hypothetical protein
LQLTLAIDEDVFQGLYPNHRATLDSFLRMRIEVRWVVDFRAFGIAMDVGKHRQNAGGVIPEDLAARLPHGD